MPKPIASLSLDLDNKWAYLRSHRVAGWDTYPSYLPLVVPRILDRLACRGLTITFFVVGRDTERVENTAPLKAIAAAGHEIANHSYDHEPWLQEYPHERLVDEIDRAEDALSRVAGVRPVGFRGPGYSYSTELHRLLAARGYVYDASTLPTFLGPLARLVHSLTSSKTEADPHRPRQRFATWRDGLRPLKPYLLPGVDRPLLEIPVTTLPLLRAPIHLTYVQCLARYSPALAKRYFSTSLAACRLAGIEPSVLLHPLDFLGSDDEPELAFFPGMDQPAARKLAVLDWTLDRLTAARRVVTMQQHADHRLQALAASRHQPGKSTSPTAAQA